MKKIYLAAAALAAFAFSACSDDKDDPEPTPSSSSTPSSNSNSESGACFAKLFESAPNEIQLCFQGKTRSFTATDCIGISQSLQPMGATANFQTSCPTTEAVLTCELERGGEVIVTSLYGQAAAGLTCDLLKTMMP